MKKLIILTLLLASIFHFTSHAQEKYGSTLNLGIGIGGYSGHYGYVGHSMPVFHLNYELDVAKNFTLAPFLGFAKFSNSYYWGNPSHPYRYYNYSETVIPIGMKGTYYFDELLKANSKWDFYLAGSLGFAIVNAHWDDGFDGDKNYYNGGSSVFLDLHIGSEYHFNNHLGAFIDLSTSVSTIGLAIH